jgi:PAS domain-containing protein
VAKAVGPAADKPPTSLCAEEGGITVVKNSDTKDYVELMRHALDYRTGRSAGGPEGLIVCDVHGSIVFANASAVDIVGLVRIGALPDDYSCMHGIFSEEGRPYPSSDVPLARAVLHGESARDVRLVVRRGDGDAHRLSVDAHPLRGASGAIIGAATTFRVVTEEETESDQH